MKWKIGLVLLAPLSLSGCASLSALATLLPAGNAAATGGGIHVTINILSNNNAREPVPYPLPDGRTK